MPRARRAVSAFRLHGRGVRQLYLAGLAADYCVYFSAKDALAAGFEVYFVEDATRAISPEGFRQARADLLQRGARFVTTAEAQAQEQ